MVVNAGCANAATGERGPAPTRARWPRSRRAALGCRPAEVVVASTGVIGVPLPMDEGARGHPRAAAARLTRDGGADAARAILTTDTRAEGGRRSSSPLGGRTARVGGMAKGAGMIAPNMATMLAFFTTDAAVEPGLLQRALREAVGESLNRITVDGDTSTNDMAVILASGACRRAGDPRARAATTTRSATRSREAARDARRDDRARRRGRDAHRRGARRGRARSEDDADRIARADRGVAAREDGAARRRSELGPHPGRGGPLGRRRSTSSRVDIYLGDVWVARGRRGPRVRRGRRRTRPCTADPVRIRVRLHAGSASGWMWTCDLSRGYVDINAHYRS